MNRYYWIRHEIGPSFTVDSGLVDEPVGTVLQRLTGLSPECPEMVRLGAEIAGASRSADVTAIIDWRDLRRAERWAAAAHAWLVAPGVVHCATTPPDSAIHRRSYLEALLLLALAERAEPARLVFAHRRPNAKAADVAPVLTRYGLGDALSELPAAGTFAADLRLSIPAQFLDVWFAAPSQRTRKFFGVYSRISMALQDTLRRWLRYEWLADLNRFSDHSTARALALYWLSPPRKAASPTEFGYDVMSDETLNRICSRAPRVAVEFKEIANRLHEASLDETAHWYRGAVKQIVEAVHREARSLRRLLAVDSDVLDRLIGFGVAAARMRDREREGEAPPPRPIDLVGGFAHDLRSHLRHGPLPHWSHDLANLVMIEATNSMRRSLRLRHGVHGELRVAIEGGRQLDFQAEALQDTAAENDEEPTSSENLTEADALPS